MTAPRLCPACHGPVCYTCGGCINCGECLCTGGRSASAPSSVAHTTHVLANTLEQMKHVDMAKAARNAATTVTALAARATSAPASADALAALIVDLESALEQQKAITIKLIEERDGYARALSELQLKVWRDGGAK